MCRHMTWTSNNELTPLSFNQNDSDSTDDNKKLSKWKHSYAGNIDQAVFLDTIYD